MEIRSLERSCVSQLTGLWNRIFTPNFKVSDAILTEKIFDDADFCPEASFWVEEGGRMVGFLAAKINHSPLEEYRSCAFLAALGVDQAFRRQGYGGRLYSLAENALREKGVRRVILGCDFRSLFSGLPSPEEESICFFQSRGFCIDSANHYDLMSDISKTEFSELCCEINENSGYSVRELDCDTIPEFYRFLDETFPGRWKYEMENYLAGGGSPCGIAVLLHGGGVEGFCRIRFERSPNAYDIVFGQNWGWLGPIGISEKARGLKLGNRLLRDALLILKARGAEHVLIDWTGLRRFYGAFGFVPFRVFRHGHKDIG